MHIQIMHLLETALLISMRLTGLMLFAPMLGSAAIPARVKAVLVLALTALLFPLLASRMSMAPVNALPLIVLHELIVGAAVGIATNIVFDGIQMAGQVLSIQMGYSLVNILDPQTQVDSTVMALFHQTIAILIFLRLGVHFWILRAVAHSFEYLHPSSLQLDGAFVTATLHLVAAAFSVGIQIAAPVLCTTLIADLALGLLGKASPQLPLLLLGPAVKSVLGSAVLIATLRYWPALFEQMFSRSVMQADRLLHLAS